MTRTSILALALAIGALACSGEEERAPEAQAPAAAERPPAEPTRIEPPVPPASDPEPAGIPESADLPPSIPPDAPIPDGEERLSDLPADVPVPPGAKAVSPVLISPEGIAHGTYELPGSAGAAVTSYTAGLLQQGWSIEPAKTSGTHALMRATKGDRQLSIAIEEIAGRAQIVILEMRRPPG